MANTIRYFSTNQAIFGTKDLEARIKDGSLKTVGLAEAIITGQAPDSGLFMPTHFPKISAETTLRMNGMSYPQVFVETMKGFFEGVLSENMLERIAQEAYTKSFKPFIEQISDINYIVRLDEGPTSAFKDYAAQVLFRVTEALLNEEPQSEVEFRQKLKDIELLTYITATSGDTGGAMGNAVLGRGRMWMAILHSTNIGTEISDLQAKQMDTLGRNVYVIRVETNFDGCQKIAQELQSDPDLKYMNMTSANSINIGRLLPQIAYYFYSYSRIAQEPGEEVYFSVPSGNFGNAVAGLFAIKMGLPAKLIIAVNENDVFERFYRTGVYEPAPETRSCSSNAMDVNWPSNMRRLFQLYCGQLIEGKDPDTGKKIIKRIVRPKHPLMKQDIAGVYRVGNDETLEIIRRFYDEKHIIGESLHSTIEPHGAVAWGATQRFRKETGYDGKIITFETAHPGKFPESLVDMGIKPHLPRNLYRLVNEPHGRHDTLNPDYNTIKNRIIELHQQLIKQ